MASKGLRPGVRATKGSAEPASPRGIFTIAAAMVLCAAALGGRAGGTNLSEALFQVLGVWLLLLLAFAPRRAASSRLVEASLYLMIATLLLSLFQLIPLPQGLWTSLSGEPVAASVYQAAGQGIGWRPLTLDIDATRDTIMTLLPPFALFLAMVEMNARERKWLALIVLAVASVSIVLGLLQFASRTALYPYPTTHEGYSVGVFSNRNHQADFTLIAALLASAFYASRKPDGKPGGMLPVLVGLGLFALVALNLMAAASRTGLLLAVPAFGACAVLAFGSRLRRKSGLISAIAVVAVAAVFLALRPDLFTHVSDRFSDTNDLRFETWPYIVQLITQYLPFGSGLGTFVPVYQSIESLDLVGPRYFNHAHNDYLEVALEMGIPGLILVGCFFALFAWAGWRAFRDMTRRDYRPFCAAAVIAILLLLAHSAVDYSLRTSTLAVTLAVLMGLLMPLPETETRRRRGDQPWDADGADEQVAHSSGTRHAVLSH
jgi:O-antigen ligase